MRDDQREVDADRSAADADAALRAAARFARCDFDVVIGRGGRVATQLVVRDVGQEGVESALLQFVPEVLPDRRRHRALRPLRVAVGRDEHADAIAAARRVERERGGGCEEEQERDGEPFHVINLSTIARLFKRLLLGALFIFVAFLAYEWLTFPDVARLATEARKTTAFMEQRREQLRAEGKDDTIHYTFVPYGRISPYLRRAV